MNIDFSVSVPDEESAHAMADIARGRGYEPVVELDDESGTWTCYCTKRLVPTYEAVVAAQNELTKLGASVGARCDGWGTFGE